MIPGVDYHETFSPVAKLVTFRIFLTLAAVYDLELGSMDVKSAFLNAPLEEEVWVKPPPHLLSLLIKLLSDDDVTDEQRRKIRRHIDRLRAGDMLKLLMALYGTKQAGRAWYILFDNFIKTLGFTANKADHCFYTKNINDHDFVLLLLYVDDIIVAATTESLVRQFCHLIGCCRQS
jgi:hypothetical protein